VNAPLDRDCRAARALISLTLDEQLTAIERGRLERHLRDCGACRLHGARVEAITGALRTAPLERPSISMLPRFSRRPRLLRTVVPALAALVAITFGLGAMQGSIGANGTVLAPPVASHQARTAYALQPQAQPASYTSIVWTP
jgi:predicted anti-sigma-YlaC factor YlaD